MSIKVKQMAANQFIITLSDTVIFQSYNSLGHGIAETREKLKSDEYKLDIDTNGGELTCTL